MVKPLAAIRCLIGGRLRGFGFVVVVDCAPCAPFAPDVFALDDVADVEPPVGATLSAGGAVAGPVRVGASGDWYQTMPTTAAEAMRAAITILGT